MQKERSERKKSTELCKKKLENKRKYRKKLLFYLFSSALKSINYLAEIQSDESHIKTIHFHIEYVNKRTKVYIFSILNEAIVVQCEKKDKNN